MNRQNGRHRSLVGSVVVTLALSGCVRSHMPPSGLLDPSDRPATQSGDSATEPAAPVGPTASPSSAALQEALRTPGAIVIATIDRGTGRTWQLHLTAVLPDRTTVRGVLVFRAPDFWSSGWGNGGETGSIRVSADGWAAIHGAGVIGVDLFGTRGAAEPIRGSGPSLLPDGTILVTLQEQIEGIRGRAEVVRSVADHGFGEIADLIVTGRMGASFRMRYVVHGDLSGIEGWVEGEGWSGVTLRWDGSIVNREPSAPPYLELGAERSAGAEGNRILPCDGWGPCALRWRRPDGTILPHASVALEQAWTRDGTAVVILDPGDPNLSGDSRLLLIRDSAAGLVTTPLGMLAPGEDAGGNYFLTGMGTWAAVLERNSDLHVNVVPLDGSPVIGPFEGTLALVNP